MTGLPARIGVIGCGNISGIYLKNSRLFEGLDVVACADLDMDRARARAAEYDVPLVCTVEELLDNRRVDVILNLTIPRAHAEIGLAALASGKHVYNEKPLALGREDARRMLEAASARGLLIGCAPDTFLGGGLQTCRKLIDDGWIGEPISASATFWSHGPETWHPDPEFFYQPGAGPMFDMGPYYITALVALMGPVRRVTGSTRTTYPERTITSEPHRGEIISVKTPTHIAGVLDFVSGAVATIVTSFDVWPHEQTYIEIFGTEGTLRVPDPNTFGGPVRVRRANAKQWSKFPLTHGHTTNSRGIGLAELARALRSGRPHRANGDLAYHVLDTMHAFFDASRENCHVELTSTCHRPAPLPLGLPEYSLDE